MSIERRITKLEEATHATEPETITIVVQRVDMAAVRANPDAKVHGREVKRVVVTRRPQ